MTFAPFNKKLVAPGDLLCLVPFPDVLLRYKFMGHGSTVVATWVERPEGRPADAIVRQCDVLRIVEQKAAG